MKSFICGLVILTILIISSCSERAVSPKEKKQISSKDSTRLDSKFSLKVGDILVRPNCSWMPGSSETKEGYMFGHAGIVVRGAEGDSFQEVLDSAILIEAHIYDRATKKFIFGAPYHVFRTRAIVTFGSKFEGNRYRLRTNLPMEQVQLMVQFLGDQVGVGKYELFSKRSEMVSFLMKQKENSSDVQVKWNCSSLVWYAYYCSANLDIDSNGGEFVYPNDLINCKIFDSPGGRCRF